MMSGVSNINEFPKGIREETFIRVPLRNLFGLWRVCRLWNSEITDDFFKKRCQMNFEGIDTIPRFYSLLTETAQTPWKLICYALSGIKFNDQLKPVAEQCATASLPNVRSYLQRRMEQFKAEQKLAIERFKAKHPGEEPILDLKVLHEAVGQLSEEFMYLNFDLRHIGGGRLPSFPKMIYDILPALIQEFPETNLELILESAPDLELILESAPDLELILESAPDENFDLRLRILDAALRLQRGISADARLIRLIELGSQLSKAMFKSKQSIEMIKLSSRIDFFTFLMQHQGETFEKALRRSYFRILSLLPHLRNWMPHMEKIRTIKSCIDNLTSGAAADSSKALADSSKALIGFIHSLPEPIQTRIWQLFKATYGFGEHDLPSDANRYTLQLGRLVLHSGLVLSTHYFSEDSEHPEFFTRGIWDTFAPPEMDPNFFDIDPPAEADQTKQ